MAFRVLNMNAEPFAFLREILPSDCDKLTKSNSNSALWVSALLLNSCCDDFLTFPSCP
jgi:hypothetical protein